MRRVEYHLDAAVLCHSGDLGNWDDQSSPVVEVRQQQKPCPLVDRKSFFVKPKDVRFLKRPFGRRLGKRELYRLDASANFEPTHRVLHLRVIQVGVKNGVARFEFVIPADEGLQRFGCTSCQRNFVRVNIQKTRDGLTQTAVRCGPLEPGKERILSVYELRDPLVFSEHRTGHDPPVTVLKVGYFVGHVIILRDRFPSNLVVRFQRTFWQRIANRSAKACGIIFPIPGGGGQRCTNRYCPRSRNTISQKLSSCDRLISHDKSTKNTLS